jgi:hypothetical protein
VHRAVVGCGAAWAWAVRSLGKIAKRGVEAELANLIKAQRTDTAEAWLFAVIAVGDPVAAAAQRRRRHHTGSWSQGDVNPGGLRSGGLTCRRRLCDTEAVSAGGGAVAPGQGRAFPA